MLGNADYESYLKVVVSSHCTSSIHIWHCVSEHADIASLVIPTDLDSEETRALCSMTYEQIGAQSGLSQTEFCQMLTQEASDWTWQNMLWGLPTIVRGGKGREGVTRDSLADLGVEMTEDLERCLVSR